MLLHHTANQQGQKQRIETSTMAYNLQFTLSIHLITHSFHSTLPIHNSCYTRCVNRSKKVLSNCQIDPHNPVQNHILETKPVMAADKTARRVYSADELHRLRSSQSVPKLQEAIEEHDGEDADLIKGSLAWRPTIGLLLLLFFHIDIHIHTNMHLILNSYITT